MIIKNCRRVHTIYYYEFNKEQKLIIQILLELQLRSKEKYTNFHFDWIFIYLLGIDKVKILNEIHLEILFTMISNLQIYV